MDRRSNDTDARLSVVDLIITPPVVTRPQLPSLSRRSNPRSDGWPMVCKSALALKTYPAGGVSPWLGEKRFDLM